MREHAATAGLGVIRLVASLVILLAARPARAQEPAGGEFQVNTYTTGSQGRIVSVARQPDGRFMAVWESVGQDGNQVGVFGQAYDAAGAPVGSEVQLNIQSIGTQRTPAVAATGNGEFVVAWDSIAQDGDFSGVFARRVGPTGVPAGLEFPVNVFTTGNQRDPRVAGSPGGFVVVWTSRAQDGNLDGIFGRCFSATGTPATGEFQVNTYTTGYQYVPDVAMNASGGFVVVWEDAPRYHGYGQRFAPGCAPVGGEFQAHFGILPAVGIDATGRFVVAGLGPGGPGDGYDVFVQRFAAGGAPDGTAFRANTYTTGFQESPRVAVEPGGDFVVSWDTYTISPLGVAAINARAFRASGAAAGAELVVNTNTTSLQARPSVAIDQDGNFVVAWTAADADNTGVKARRFLAPDLIFADGFDGGTLAAWSSSSNDGGDLSVTGAAGMASTGFGLQGLIDDTAGIYVQDDSPSDENRYHARFYFDPNGFDPGVAQSHLRTRIFIGFEEAPMRRLFAVVVRLSGGQYGLMGRVRNDDNSQTDTGFFPIDDGPHSVEIDWKRSSGPDALDGSFQMWIDGSSVSTLTGLDNSTSSVDFARLGALSVKTGATGTLFWDEFESRRRSQIDVLP